MCFSASASFTAGTLLLGLGTLTWKAARHPRERPFAAIPLLFAAQQFIEGVIWMTFGADAGGLNALMTYAYSVFSDLLWPVSHTFERSAGYYLPIAAGSCVAFARSVALLAEDFKAVRPTILISVPRICERIYAKLHEALVDSPFNA